MVRKRKHSASNKVLVRWKIKGAMIIEGQAYSRSNGDEDHVAPLEAKTMAATGQVDIVGFVDEVAHRKSIAKVRR